jgi:hypothetical protein
VTVFAQALLALVGGDFMAFTFFTARHLVENLRVKKYEF